MTYERYGLSRGRFGLLGAKWASTMRLQVPIYEDSPNPSFCFGNPYNQDDNILGYLNPKPSTLKRKHFRGFMWQFPVGVNKRDTRRVDYV